MRPQILVPLVALSALTLVACGGRDVRSFEEVERDFESPTGTVDEASAPVVFSQALEVGDADATTAVASQVDTTGTLDQSLLQRTGELAWNRDALMGDGCDVHMDADGSGAVRTIEVECGSSPEYDGSFLMEFEYSGHEIAAIWIDFDMWCDSAGCVDGSMGNRFRVSGDVSTGLTMTFLSTARLDLHQEGVVTHVEWGFRMVTDESSATVEWLVYGEEAGETRSWVLSATADETGGTLEVRGANGSFTCSYDGGGESGQCTGSDGGTFSWS